MTTYDEKQHARNLAAFELGLKSITRVLKKDNFHENYFAVALMLAERACSANGHLTQDETAHNLKLFMTGLAELAIEFKNIRKEIITTKRLM